MCARGGRRGAVGEKEIEDEKRERAPAWTARASGSHNQDEGERGQKMLLKGGTLGEDG